MKNIAVLLSGRGSNFKAIYNAIETKKIKNAQISVVISDKSDAPGLKFAKEKGLNAFFVNPKEFSSVEEFDKKIVEVLNSFKIDLVCLAGFMRIITPYFVRTYKNRIINIHPSLLPSFPGLNAQRQALEYGVRFSGCTVHFVDEEVDHGPIILQAVVPVLPNDTVETLSERILKEEHRIYPEAVKLFVEDKLKIVGRKVIVKED
ncbi:phosphoribosylglycinamide formyltransferase [Deferribacter autotrophicus]|uniref:Phosphoribosylglycinamide formyltransferase n=1 Tax=Deferribacter autotrophicus TaxID=500465 RepID=A0A5A8F451_9BACT|nr:phosphoribosylglycinamide formyltransferase [Deferribacter autotrophicus]KAA0258816.1 phosphoribosylglycinamide formyltransferase [Deferribacter autotrophicus]